MRMRVLVVTAALAVAGACAHGSSRSDTVSDEVLARVPPNQMASVDQARTELAASFRVIGAALERRRYLTGDEISLADLSLMPYVGMLGLVSATDLLKAEPALDEWWSRTSERASWKGLPTGE